jgi:hypothetical protein
MFHTTQKKSPKIHPKPFCKVCHDAGKSEAEYTSHFVKSEPGANGVVVCPTLLAQGCGFCHEFGHTVKYCMKLKNREKNTKKIERRVDYQRSEHEVKKVEQKVNSRFALLANDSDECRLAKKPKSIKKESVVFPVLADVKVKPNTEPNTKISYASMAAKPAIQMTPCEPNYPPPNTITVPTIGDYITKATKRTPMKNWADWSDSEDEEEEYYRDP